MNARRGEVWLAGYRIDRRLLAVYLGNSLNRTNVYPFDREITP